MTTPDPTPDYLILGSGLAGLSFAALMANAGRRVTVIEAHDAPGGYGHTFEEARQYRFNAQLHYVWNCGPGQPVYRFLEKLGLEDEVTFETYDPTGFDHMRMPGFSLDIPGDYPELARRLRDLFPAAAGPIRHFLDEVQGTAREIARLPKPLRPWSVLAGLPGLRRLIRYRRATLQEVFDRSGLPAPAQTLLALQWPDFLLPPDRLSFFAWVMLFDGYMQGAYYPTRHFEHFVESLVRLIRERGGQVLYERKVVDFVLEGDRVTGALVEDLREPGNIQVFSGGEVVCNFDPRRAAEMIGLERFSPALRRKLNYEYSPSNFMAYLVVDGLDLRDHGFGRWNLFHSEQPDLNRCFHDMYVRGDYSRPSFALTTPTLLTDVRGDCPEGKQIVELLTVADYKRFLDLKISNEKAYRRAKRAILDQLLEIVERDYVPGFREHLVFKMTGSPTTSERFVWAPQGNSYGSNMTPSQIGPGRLDHRSSIENLWFCNASSGYAGFAGTIWTGRSLYETLTGDRLS